MTLFDPVPAGAADTPLAASHRRILTSAAMLGGTTVLIKLVALAKDWLVARRFGAGDDLDAFLVALLIPTYAVVVLAHSFASGFLPTYIRVWERHSLSAAQRLVGSVLAGAAGVLTVITLLLAGVARYLIPLVGTGFDPAKLALAESLFYILAGMLIVTGISAIFAAVLNAHERFAIPALAPLAIPVFTIGVFWLLEDRLGIYALAGGTLLGFVMECAILAGGMQRHGLLGWPRWHGLDEDLRHVGSQYVPIVVGSLLMSSAIVVDQSMAASLGSGNVSVLNYGNKIVALVLNVVAISLSTVLFPRFSRMITAGQWDELNRTIRVYSKAILIASIPGVALLAVVSEPLVRLLFERGAFTPETTRAVTEVQICYLPQIPFAVLVILGYRMLSALDGNRLVLAIGALNLLMNVGGNLVFMRRFGVNGIAMSTSLMYLVATLATLAAIRYKLADAHTLAGRSGPSGPA